MKKGDDRRQALIDTAERLFYSRGYEQTSIQDILDALKFSKGGFYHHFESKHALMEAICVQRAQESGEAARAAVEACDGSAVDKLNAIFDLFNLERYVFKCPEFCIVKVPFHHSYKVFLCTVNPFTVYIKHHAYMIHIYSILRHNFSPFVKMLVN